MSKLLVVNHSRKSLLRLQQQLAGNSQSNFILEAWEGSDISALSDQSFDVLLFVDDGEQESNIEQLNLIYRQAITTPLLVVSEHNVQNLVQQVRGLTSSDILPQNDLTPAFLKYVIQHASHKARIKFDLAHMSTHDQLTSLPNRFLFIQHLEHAISLSKRSSQQFTVLLIDLDKFNQINQSLGHEIGDLLLQHVAERLVSCLRDADIIARLGNDEFAVLLQNGAQDTSKMVLVAEKIQAVLMPAFYVRDQEFYLTASIGIAGFPECGLDSKSLLKNADSALNKAKQLGRNQFYFFDKALNHKAKVKLELEKSLRRALIKGEFEIYLQPQVYTDSEKVVGAEALLRWNHPSYGYISPEVFIPLLEELGLLVGVERWVVNQVCLLAKELTDRYGHLRFSVNISGSHFKTGNLKENIYMALQSSSLDANNLEVELTEDIMIDHSEENTRLLAELKEIGVSIALDDFGKGYSSLSYLKNFPADILKIDKAFIDQLDKDARDSAIVESLIDLSHRLGIKVVAEGVEQVQQLNHLKNIGCDYIQGYYFAKPMARQDFEVFVESSLNPQSVATSTTGDPQQT